MYSIIFLSNILILKLRMLVCVFVSYTFSPRSLNRTYRFFYRLKTIFSANINKAKKFIVMRLNILSTVTINHYGTHKSCTSRNLLRMFLPISMWLYFTDDVGKCTLSTKHFSKCAKRYQYNIKFFCNMPHAQRKNDT